MIPISPSLIQKRDMTKTYKSGSDISINVILSDKKNLHISFTPSSDGTSTYTTKDANVQAAIEKHYRFGKLFRLALVEDERKPKEKPVQAAPASKNEEIIVPDLSVAKDILADRFGISRTLLRTKDAIIEHAAAHGVVFKGI